MTGCAPGQAPHGREPPTMNDALMNYFAAHADAMLALAGQLVTQST
ncbi:MAG: hypothetical protein R2838_02140 [Caldilineaceae bacterium]